MCYDDYIADFWVFDTETGKKYTDEEAWDQPFEVQRNFIFIPKR